MNFIQTELQDVIIAEPAVFGDARGYFMESFNAKNWEGHIPNRPFVQDNESFSSRGVLRGMHFQKPPHAQAKLVRVIHGEVLDVILDIRKSSSTYGQYIGVLLSEENKRQLYVPRGFAHAFVVLSETALFAYKCDNYYNKETEGGIDPLDTTLDIDWHIPKEKILLSEKDAQQAAWGSHYIFT